MNLAVSSGWRARSLHLLLNGLVFGIFYPLTNFLAWRAQVQDHLAFPFETATPFLPWLIVPYLSSGLLFVASFYWAATAEDLRLLSRRMLLCTLIACLAFTLCPLRLEQARPQLDSPLLDALFGLLDGVDRPYNQLPSLHVAYCMLYWAALRGRAAAFGPLGRAVLAGWLLLVVASTVLTYQHQWIDVAGGLALGAAALVVLRPGMAPRHAVAFHYAIGAGLVWLMTQLLAALPTPPLERFGWQAAAGYYVGASLLLICLAYLRDDRHFLRKHTGRHPLWIWLLYAPYLAAYRLTWHAVRWRERHRPPFEQWSERLWVGRRLTSAEAAALPAGCAVIDLANELSETMQLRTQAYRHFPLLDLHVPDAQALRPILDAMADYARQGRDIYLHCSMGYHRSRLVARLFTETTAT